MSRLDYMYLSNGNNSDYSYQLLREHIRFVLIECEEKLRKLFLVSQWVPIKLTVIAPPGRVC